MRKAYGSDVSREQFNQVSRDSEFLKKMRPREVDLYDVFCVNYYYGIWTKKNKTGESIPDHILAKLVELERYEAGRNPLPSMFIVDSKSFKNADTANEKGYYMGKKLLA